MRWMVPSEMHHAQLPQADAHSPGYRSESSILANPSSTDVGVQRLHAAASKHLPAYSLSVSWLLAAEVTLVAKVAGVSRGALEAQVTADQRSIQLLGWRAGMLLQQRLHGA